MTVTFAPHARNARDTDCERLHDVGRDPVAEHDLPGELVVGGRALGVVAMNGTAASIAATSAPECDATISTSPMWSMCWWVTITSSRSSIALPCAASARCSSSSARPEFGPGVDERERLVLDQVAVDAADRERRRDRQAVDAGLGGGGEGVVAHARISASTSSRFSSMWSGETSDSRFSRSSGSVFDGRTLKCQSS